MNHWNQLKFWSTNTCSDLTRMIHNPVNGNSILPNPRLVTRAFELTPFNEVKAVILGQDPYHTRGMANGLAFSVNPDVKRLPPSLRNLLTEYSFDLDYPRPTSGSLVSWAKNGVLLLNTILTVEEGKPLSHKGLGWEKLTYEALKCLNEYRENIVFVLLGKYAQEFAGGINLDRHCVLATSHPSPLSSGKGFMGSRIFSRTNKYLDEHSVDLIDWRLR